MTQTGFRETPKAWRQQLRAFGVPNDRISWLELHWNPWWERWVVYQCIPPERTTWYVRQRPSSGTPVLNLDPDLMDGMQWHLYRTRGVFASSYWVVQGSFGGHRRQMYPYEQNLAQMMGMPARMPYPGELRYANFGHLTMAALHKLDRVGMWNKMLEYTDRNASTLDTDEEEGRVLVLRNLAKWVQEQTGQAFQELARSDIAELTSVVPTGVERKGIRALDFEEWFESQMLPRHRKGVLH